MDNQVLRHEQLDALISEYEDVRTKRGGVTTEEEFAFRELRLARVKITLLREVNRGMAQELEALHRALEVSGA